MNDEIPAVITCQMGQNNLERAQSNNDAKLEGRIRFANVVTNFISDLHIVK